MVGDRAENDLESRDDETEGPGSRDQSWRTTQ
jgi:hypothetical protein